jgi:hypothetical protein
MAQPNYIDNMNQINQFDNMNHMNHMNQINQNDNLHRVYCSRCNFVINHNANIDTPILCNRCYMAYCDYHSGYENAHNLDQNMAHHADCLENHFDQKHGGDVAIQGNVFVCSRNHNYDINTVINSIRATQEYMNFRNM